MNKNKFDLAVIGAGPAGMMAALRAAECGANVILVEKNSTPGIKLLITGKERCNITNAELEVRKFVSVFGKNGKFLINALNRFGVKETENFFHTNNLPTKVERGGRIFPVSDKAGDVLQLLLKLLKKNNVVLRTDCNIKKIVHKNNLIAKIITDIDEINASNYLIATGGLSYPKTGSSGDGYVWANEMGHKVVETRPALTPVIVNEKWIKELEGLSLKNVTVSIYQNNKKCDERFGEALFTGNGMSGPIILDLSKTIGNLLVAGHVDLFIDFKPALDFEKLDKRILRDLERYGKKTMKNLLSELLPGKLIPIMLRLTGIDPEKQGNSVSKEERRKLRQYLKQFPLTVKSLLGFSKAIITTGGVSLKEIDPKTMRSKLVENLYFSGEIMDLDGPTGGYNLQVCWSTGFVAGTSVGES